MVTKQQQLEWLAKKCKTWSGQDATYLCLSVAEVGQFAVVNAHVITRKEWKQERDKMQQQQSKLESSVMTLDEAIAHANEKSCELQGNCAANHKLLAHWLSEYRDILSKNNLPEVDNSWHERGELPTVGCECEIKHKCWGGFQRVTVVAITKEYAIVEDDSVVAREQQYQLCDMTFRPLRTKREKAIDAACEAIGKVDERGLLMLERLYDAGLLK